MNQNPIAICSRCEFAQQPGTCNGSCNCLADPNAPVDISIRAKGVCPKGYFDGSWKAPVRQSVGFAKPPFAQMPFMTREQYEAKVKQAQEKSAGKKKDCNCSRAKRDVSKK